MARQVHVLFYLKRIQFAFSHFRERRDNCVRYSRCNNCLSEIYLSYPSGTCFFCICISTILISISVDHKDEQILERGLFMMSLTERWWIALLDLCARRAFMLNYNCLLAVMDCGGFVIRDFFLLVVLWMIESVIEIISLNSVSFISSILLPFPCKWSLWRKNPEIIT